MINAALLFYPAFDAQSLTWRDKQAGTFVAVWQRQISNYPFQLSCSKLLRRYSLLVVQSSIRLLSSLSQTM